MLINLRNALMGKRLPYDAELEYLESTGTQYIALPPLPNPCTFEFEATFAQSSSAGTSSALFGCKRGDVSANNIMQFVPKYPLYDLCGASPTRSLPSTTLPNDTFVTVSHKGGIFDFDGEKLLKTNTYSTVNNYSALGLFCAWSQSTGVFGEIYRCKLANFKVWIDGILRYDFIPVRVGTVGYLYDRVTGKLFGNAGTGDFVLGPDVVPVEYIESHGTEWIDTGVVPDFNTEVRLVAGYTAYVQGTQIFGARTGSANSGRYFPFGASDATSARMVMVDSIITLSYSYDGSLHNVIFNDEYHRCYFDGTLKNTWTSGNTVSENNPLYIFGTSGYSTSKWTAKGRVASAEIIKSSSPAKRFFSVRVGTDTTSWEGAMMDVLTRRIYRNQGTGAFAYGNDLKYPIPAE